MRNLFILLFFLVARIGVQAQTAEECLLKMPEDFLPYLTETNRADMPDFLKSNMLAQVKNRFSEQTQMLQLSDSYLCLMLDSAAVLQLKLLPLGDGGKIIALAYTLKAPAADSDLRFYTTEWKSLPSDNYFRRPEADDFFLPADSLLQAGVAFDSVERQEAWRVYREAPFMEYKFSSDSNDLQITQSVAPYLDEESRPQVLKYLRKEPKILKWRNEHFE